MKNTHRKIYQKVKSKNFNPQNICEVGVYKPQQSNILDFILDGIKATLVEADPECIKSILDYFKEKENIIVIEAAVCDFDGEVELCKSEASTFLSELKASPALINDNYVIKNENKFIAKAVRFSKIDKGEFDLISMDVEGAEWFVLKNMISRPAILSIETHGKYYTNPFINEINNWMEANNYDVWFKDKSDTIFAKRNVISVTAIEKFKICVFEMNLFLVKKKKILKKIKRLQ